MQTALAVPTPVGELPARLDRTYELIEQLHTGGMGQIYRAVSLLAGDVVALKLVRPPAEDSHGGVSGPSYRLALALEFQTLASLHHPNIIRVQSYGFDERFGPYFTMELLDGAPTIVEAAAGRDDAGRVELAAQLLRAVAYIHRRGVLHRDIKPANVLVEDGEVKLLDFGLATEANQVTALGGTRDYMAPELFEGTAPSVASDLFSIGVLLHAVFAGHAPDVLRGGGADTVQISHEGIDADGPTMAGGVGPIGVRLVKVAGPLGEVVETLLRRRPADRYPDAESTLRALAAAVDLDIPVETAQTRESFLQATVLVGRDAQLAELRRTLDGTREHRGATVLVAGESGVGKSRLLAEMRTVALVYGHWAATGQSVTEGGRLYDEWLPVLRELCLRIDVTDDEAAVLADLVPDLERVLGRKVHGARPAASPDEAQARLAATVAGMLARLSRPMLLVIEDLQWARAESLNLIARLSERIDELPVLLLGSYRSDEAPWLLAAMPRARHLSLGRLDRESIERLATSMLGDTGRQADLIDYLVRHTEGNVFFLIEIVRALAETSGELGRITEQPLLEGVLTSGIERIVERRLTRVADQWRPFLDFAATLGRRLDLDTIAHAFPTLSLATALVDCANAAVLESFGSEWRFAHDKLRETLLRRLAPEQRRELHQRVAYALEAVYPAVEREPLAPMFAYHFAHAGLPERALPWYLRAGDQAVRLSLWEEARQHFAGAQAALEQLPDGEERRRTEVDLLSRHMYTTIRTDKLDVQLARYDQAHALLESLRPPIGMPAEDRLRLARLDCYRGHALYYGGQPAEAIRCYQRVLPAARESDDQELLMLPASMIAASLTAQGNMGQAEALFAQAVAPLEKFANTYDWTRGRLLHSVALVATGRYRDGIDRMLVALADVERLDRPALLALVNVALGPAYRIAGEWPRMLEAARAGVDYARRSGEQMHLYMGWNEEAWALAHLGRHAEAAERRASAGELAAKLGGKLPYSDWFEAGNAEQDLLARRFPEALAIAKVLVEKGQAAGLVVSRGIAERVWAAALSRLGAELPEIEEHLQESLRVFDGGRNVLDAARTELYWARILRDRGDADRAAPHLAAARAVFAHSGCDYALDECERVARRP